MLKPLTSSSSLSSSSVDEDELLIIARFKSLSSSSRRLFSLSTFLKIFFSATSRIVLDAFEWLRYFAPRPSLGALGFSSRSSRFESVRNASNEIFPRRGDEDDDVSQDLARLKATPFGTMSTTAAAAAAVVDFFSFSFIRCFCVIVCLRARCFGEKFRFASFGFARIWRINTTTSTRERERVERFFFFFPLVSFSR